MPRGRPREFDVEKALDRALEVFWRKGYEGASLPDLTRAMGINRPSLYAAFGSKEGLFRRALDRYAEGPAGYVAGALAEPTARAVAEGDLPSEVDCADLARYVVTMIHGMAVQAAGGASREELLRVAELALRAWPV